MPDPDAQPDYPAVRRVARRALLAGALITGFKFGVYILTNSAAVLSDALESIINIGAAALMLYSVAVSNKPADRSHPYGHGKIEFLVTGVEGGMIIVAGMVIVVEAGGRLASGTTLDLARLGIGMWCVVGLTVLTLALAVYVWSAGRRYDNAILIADGKHLFTDFVSTVGVVAGLVLVKLTGRFWLDPVVALLIAGPIFWTGRKLLRQAIDGLMDRTDPGEAALIQQILDRYVADGAIGAYHKVRHRHSGAFHWVDMHLQVDPEMSVTAAHRLASRIEHDIEQALGPSDATAHLEPAEAPGAHEGAGAAPEP